MDILAGQKHEEMPKTGSLLALKCYSFIVLCSLLQKGHASDSMALIYNSDGACPIIQEEIVRPTITQRFSTLVTEKGRRTIGQYYVNATGAIDRFLSGQAINHQYNNDSYLKGEWRGTQFENGKSDTDVRVKAKIKLPNTKKRARLFFDSDLREENSVDQRVRSVSRGEQLQTSSSTAGLELIKRKSNPLRWTHSVKTGIKLNDSLDPFIRYRLLKRWVIGESIANHFSQDFYYLDGVGWGETTRHQFTININPLIDFDIISELDYRDEPEPVFFYHLWRLTQQVNERTYFSYNAAVLSEDSKKKYINKRLVSLDIRYRLPGDWFYLTVTPELLQQDENLWDNEWSLTLKLEFFFTEEQDTAFYRKRY